MATTKSLIDDLLRFVEGVSPNSGQFLPLRRKAKRNLQRALDEDIWTLPQLAHLGQFNASPTIVVNSGRTYLDVGFEELISLGTHGLVVVDRIPLRWVSAQEMEALYQLRDTNGNLGQPNVFTDQQYVVLLGFPGTQGIYVHPSLASAAGHTATISYRFLSPKLVDTDDVAAGEPTGSDSLVDEVPLQWHTTLYEFAAYRQMLDKGNVQQAAAQRAIAERALRNMIATERRGQSRPTRIPAFGARR